MEKLDFLGIIGHEFFMSFYGVFAWFTFNWAREKKKHPRLTFKKWWQNNATDVLVAVVVGFAIVAWDDEIISAYNSFVEEDITLSRWMYLLPGFLTAKLMNYFHKEDAKIYGT